MLCSTPAVQGSHSSASTAWGAVRGILNSPVKIIQDALITRCAQMLACYRNNGASSSSGRQLILPEGRKLLPV